MKFFCQSSNGQHRSKEILSGLHQENEDKNQCAKMSIITLLSNTNSSMQILTKQIITHNVQGTIIVFPSCLYHESHYTDKKTMKLCSFLREEKRLWPQEIEINVLQEILE